MEPVFLGVSAFGEIVPMLAAPRSKAAAEGSRSQRVMHISLASPRAGYTIWPWRLSSHEPRWGIPGGRLAQACHRLPWRCPFRGTAQRPQTNLSSLRGALLLFLEGGRSEYRAIGNGARLGWMFPDGPACGRRQGLRAALSSWGEWGGFALAFRSPVSSPSAGPSDFDLPAPRHRAPSATHGPPTHPSTLGFFSLWHFLDSGTWAVRNEWLMANGCAREEPSTRTAR